MRYYDVNEGGDLFSILECQQHVALNMKGINKLNSLIDWELFREELEAIQGYQCRDD